MVISTLNANKHKHASSKQQNAYVAQFKAAIKNFKAFEEEERDRNCFELKRKYFQEATAC